MELGKIKETIRHAYALVDTFKRLMNLAYPLRTKRLYTHNSQKAMAD